MAITKEQAIDILDKFDFFQGQRAGRELWNDKPYEVQEEDIKAFSRDVAELKAYVADVVPKSEVDRLNAVMKEMDEQRAYTINMLGESLEKAKAEVIEIENKLRPLEDKLLQYEHVCGKLIIKDGVGIGLLPDGKETVYILKSIASVTKELAIRRTKREVAMEIFEEIEKLSHRFMNDEHYIFGDMVWDIAELKKKYTEGE